MSSVYEVINPATEKVVKAIELADQAATDAAIERAHKAFDSWRHVAPGDRAKLLRSFAAVVSAHREELASLEIENSGHTRGNALWEADNVANVLNYYSAAPERLFGKQIPVPNGIDITFKEPLGVIGVIVPWNFPMPIAGWGFAPALAAGNTVVLKPAEYTPMTAIRLAELALEAGLPKDVFTVIPGKGSIVGARFVTHPKVRKIVFTGSTEVGKSIMAGCADQVKRVTLELGGKSANIIFADSDIEKAAANAPGAVFDNAGQDLDEPVAFTGSAPSGPGFWLPPTVLMPTSTQSKAWNEEIFGPVVSVMTFDGEDDAIAKANDTEFGLSGSIWTRDSGKAIRVSRAIESGNLSVNSNSSVRYWTPFGGYKQSGLGRELGPDALDSFTEVKNVFISTEK